MPINTKLLGGRANPPLTATKPDPALNRWKNNETDEIGATSLYRVFAGGDVVRGGATVILAINDTLADAGSRLEKLVPARPE